MGNGVDIKVDQSIIQPIMEKQICAAIVQNLGNETALIEKMVSLALHVQVDYNGNKPKYSSDGKYDFLEWMVKNGIQDAAQKAFRDWLKENTEKVRQAVITEMQKPSRQKSMAKAFADAVEKSIKYSWNMTCNVDFKRDNDC